MINDGVCWNHFIPLLSSVASGSWSATRKYGSIHQKLEKDKTSRAIPVEIGNIIPHLFNRKVSKENIFFRNKPCKAFPLIQGEFWFALRYGSLSRGLGCLTDTPRLPEESGHSFRLQQRNKSDKFYLSRKLHRLLISFHAGQISYGVPNPFPLFPTELHSSHNRLPYLWPTRRGRTVNKWRSKKRLFLWRSSTFSFSS